MNQSGAAGGGWRPTFLLVEIVVEVLLALNSWRVAVIGQPVAFPVFMIIEERSGGLEGWRGWRGGGQQKWGKSKERAGHFTLLFCSFLFFKSKL